MIVPLRSLLFAGCLGLLAGCADSDPPPSAPPAVATAATDDEAGIRLDVSMDRAEMTTADRLGVRIEVTRPVGLPITLIEPDWSAANWTLTDTIDTAPVQAPDGRITRTLTVVLEPFLDGDYAVPPVTLTWARDGLDSVIASQSLAIPVRSVLPEADDGELAAAMPTLPPPTRDRSAPWLPVTIGCGGLIALATAWVLVRRRPRQPAREPTALEILRSEASSANFDAARTHRALTDLTAEGKLPVETLHQFERARFDPGSGPGEAAEVIRHALAALEVTP
jgi:hypothetical protein